ncbi:MULTISPECIES: hypothetical protein [unclassified Streptomyces]|uniref:hypothetical protein n=1 Tax=unclassified Streptomyces TaxID=2593676 RepID=UPI00081E9BC8|nr:MULTISPECIES: hypothetical protein [unclassified Streptomyces]MYR30570.1 hypothetical protein [Streptomyces sp. SID4945]SCF50147.1 hypothetical protein GA0115257_12419 [Streptomyces sp. LcepLS]
MTRRLTPAEQLAADARDTTLGTLIALTDPDGWHLRLVKQAVLAAGRWMPEFSANDFRDLLPELGAGMAGLACHALLVQGLVEKTGDRVPSTLPSTHGHGIHVYRLTALARTAGTEAAA